MTRPTPTRRRPSPALIVAVLALVVALGGTSYAAGLIGSAQVRDESLRGVDVKNGTIGTAEIRDGSLLRRDIAGGLTRGPRGPQGPQGPEGPAGLGRWALVDATGAIVAQSGGFSVTAAYPELPNTAPDGSPSNALRANGNVYIDAGEDLGDNGILAVVALQNTVDQNGDGLTNGRGAGPDANPEFSGEIAVSQCGVPSTACAPPGTGNVQHLVVSPRLSDGSFTTGSNRKRFYVIVTGDSAAPVTP